jgi:hypothetical protein
VRSAAVEDVLDQVPEVATLAALPDASERAVNGIPPQLLEDFLPTVQPRALASRHRPLLTKISEPREELAIPGPDPDRARTP